MAWVHPLDLEGSLERSDWIAVEGRAFASGATVGTIVLSEPGAYVVRPLWRGWGGTMDDPHENGRGYPDSIRLEVVEPGASVGDWATLLSATGALASGLAASNFSVAVSLAPSIERWLSVNGTSSNVRSKPPIRLAGRGNQAPPRIHPT